MDGYFVWTEGRVRNLLALIADKENVLKAIADAGFTVEELCEMNEPVFSNAVDKVFEVYFHGKGQRLPDIDKRKAVGEVAQREIS